MLRKILLASAALVAFAGAATAADLPARMPTKAVPYVQMYNWTGLYVGANIGYGWGRDSAGGATTTLNGLIGGGQIGYNWQMNNIVLGVETDFQGSGQRATATGAGFTVSERIRYFGTVRARLGYAMDRFLPYITGGLAWGTTDYGNIYGVDTSSTNWGWTIGAGVEYAFTNNWTAKIEYQYIDLEGSSYTIAPTLGSISADTQLSVVKLGLNYKF